MTRPSVKAICSRRSKALEIVGKTMAVSLPCASATSCTGFWMASHTKASVSHQPRAAPTTIAIAEMKRRLRSSMRCAPSDIRFSRFLSPRSFTAVIWSGALAGARLVGLGHVVTRRGSVAVSLVGAYLGLQDLHRLPEAAGEGRQLGCAEEQQDDHEDDQRMPAGEALPHRCSSVSWGDGVDSLPVDALATIVMGDGCLVVGVARESCSGPLGHHGPRLCGRDHRDEPGQARDEPLQAVHVREPERDPEAP